MGRWKVGAQNTAVGKKYRCSLKQSTNQCATFRRHIFSIIYTLYPLLQMHSQSPTHKADNLFGRDQCKEVVPPSASSGCAKVSIIADSVIVLHYLSYEDMENLDQNQKQMINSIPLFVIPPMIYNTSKYTNTVSTYALAVPLFAPSIQRATAMKYGIQIKSIFMCYWIKRDIFGRTSKYPTVFAGLRDLPCW